MSGAWLPVYEDLPRHPKTIVVALELDIPEAQVVGHLVCLWLWAINNAPEGKLPKSHVIERLVGWFGERGALTLALVHAGWLDAQTDGSTTIHDWHDYAGRLLERRAKDKARKDAWREARQSRDVDATRTGRGQDADVHVVPRVTDGVNSDSDSDSDKNLRLSEGRNEVAPQANSSPNRTEGQLLVAAFVDAYTEQHNAKPTKRLLGQWASTFADLLRCGHDERVLAEAMRACVSSGKGPSILELKVGDLKSGNAPARADPEADAAYIRKRRAELRVEAGL